MKKIEAVLDVVTRTKLNTFLTVSTLLLIGYVLGFVMIKIA